MITVTDYSPVADSRICKYAEGVGYDYHTVIREMRSWVEDCAVDECDLEDIQEATALQIVMYVKNNYEGGISEFLNTIA